MSNKIANIHIAIDMMGGDFGLDITIPGIVRFLSIESKVNLILVGSKEEIVKHLANNKLVKKNQQFYQRIAIVNTSQIVYMDESPLLALRRKIDSSMRVALNLVAENQADACVSAGNTGALMLMATYVLKTLPGIERPAILYPIPSKGKSVSVLDLGANIDCTANQLLQFAVMGSALVSVVENKADPKIGLLNIGKEEIKGTATIKEAGKLIANCEGLNYCGFIEGDDIYKGTVDLVVCDGFVGNVMLKVSEGLAKLIIFYLKKGFLSNWYNKFVGLLAKPILKKLMDQINPSKYNGASLLGLNGIVVKSHGGADPDAFSYAIKAAYLEATKKVPLLIKEKVAWQLGNM